MGLDPQVLAGIRNTASLACVGRVSAMFTDGLRDISSDRRWAILAVCAVEWEAAVADAVVETHDRIVRKTWRENKEETGLTLQRLYSADICEQFYEADRDAISLLPVFVGFAGSTETVRLNAEHSEFQWVPFDQAVNMVPFAGQRNVLRHVQKEFVEQEPNRWLLIHPPR